MHRRVFFIFAAALCAAVVRADLTTLPASADNTVFENNLSNSAGGAQVIFAGANGQSVTRRGLISFNIANSIPTGSTIDSVQLTLYLNQFPNGATGSPTIRLFHLLDDWGEGTAGNTTHGASGAGQGFAAGEGDATWLARHYSATTPTLHRRHNSEHALYMGLDTDHDRRRSGMARCSRKQFRLAPQE